MAVLLVSYLLRGPAGHMQLPQRHSSCKVLVHVIFRLSGMTQEAVWLHIQAQAPAPSYLHFERAGAARVPTVSLQPLLAIRTPPLTSSKAMGCPALAGYRPFMATGCSVHRRVVFAMQRSAHSRIVPVTSWRSQPCPSTIAGMHCQHDCVPGGRRWAARGTLTPLPVFAGPNRQRPCYGARGCAHLSCPAAALLLVCCTWLSKAQTSQLAAWRPALVAVLRVNNITRHAGAAARQRHAGFLPGLGVERWGKVSAGRLYARRMPARCLRGRQSFAGFC